jgi:excisionase family DNA binding protein
MMSIFEAATYLGVSVFSLRKLARESRIPAGKVGRQWRFSKEDLDAFLREQYGTKKEAVNG